MQPPTHRLYGDLATWWPLLSPPEGHAEAAQLHLQLLEDVAGQVTTLLELGSGGGSLASHLPDRVLATLVDISPQMITQSKKLNARHRHHQDDVRSLRLPARFDAVLMHDAVMYMTSAEDLQAAIMTAAHHLRPGGAALFLPDVVAETFEDGHTLVGGFDHPGCAARLTEWHHSPHDHRYVVDFSLMLREGSGPTQCIHESHQMGLFSFAEWTEMLTAAGFDLMETVTDGTVISSPIFRVRRRP